MNADEVRNLLEKDLGGPFTKTTWKRFYKNDVEYFLEHQSPEEWRSLKDVAKDLFEYEKELKQELASGGGSERMPRNRRQRQRKSRKKEEAVEEHWFPELTCEEMLRVEVYGEYLAKVAATVHYVVRYRERVLADRMATLTPDQAQSLIRSAAAQTLPPASFRRLGISVRNHNAEFRDHEFDVDEGNAINDYATLRVWWAENPEGIAQRVLRTGTEGKDLTRFDFRNEESEDDYILVRQDSVLGELQRVASRLTEQFPWREAQATWFVLTGEPPLVSPVKVRYTLDPANVHLPSGETIRFAYGEVTISAAPWVSEKIVAGAYYNLQSRILPGKQNRAIEQRRLEVLRFVLQRENPIELTQARRRRIGKELVEAWDRKNPHWSYGHYEQPTSVFWDTFNDAEKLVLHPSWTHPRKLGSTGKAGAS